MKRVRLKDKSPEFAEDIKNKLRTHVCDIDGCDGDGEFKAPKDRGLNVYHHLCKAHITDYNRAWNFFDGMADQDVQAHVYASLFGDRPTWKYTAYGDLEDKLREQASGFRNDDHRARVEEEKERRRREKLINPQTPEGEAMQIMGLTPPLDMAQLKTQYKTLAKKHHPDTNRDDPDAEEKLKDINMAYTVLRLAYQKSEESGLT